MPVAELPKTFQNVLESLGQSLEPGVYKPVKDNMSYPDGTTLVDRYSELYSQLSGIAQALGINYVDCGYTFTVTKSKNNGKVYINYPSVRLVEGVPTLCWGEVKREIGLLNTKAMSVKEVTSASNKPGAKSKFFLECKLQTEYWDALGVTSVQFPMSTVDEVNVIKLNKAVDCPPTSDNYQTLWAEVLRTGGGNFKPFPQSLGKVFMKHPEVDSSNFIASVKDMLSQPACEPLAMRLRVTDARIEDGKFGQSLVMTLEDTNPYCDVYGDYKVGIKSQLGYKFDPQSPEDFIGTEFTVVAEGIGNKDGTDYVKTRIEALMLPMALNGDLPSWSDDVGF